MKNFSLSYRALAGIMKKVLCLFLLLWLGADLHVLAGARLRSITMRDGLPSDAVRSLVQDERGFVWMGTDYGLCRYDGVEVKRYTMPIKGADQFVAALLPRRGSVLVGTTQGLLRLDLHTEKFHRVAPTLTDVVKSLSSDRAGNVWIATARRGVYCLTAGGSLRHYALSTPSQYAAQVFVDRDGQVWAYGNNTSSCLERLDRVRNRFVPFHLSSGQEDCRGLCLTQTSDGALWLGTWTNGLVRVDANGQVMPLMGSRGSKHIHALLEWKPGEMLVASDEGVTSYALSPLGTVAQATWVSPLRFVYALMKDQEGGLWMGSFYNGVAYQSPDGDRFLAFTVDQGLRGNVVSGFCEDGKGHVWVASDDGGVACFSLADDKLMPFAAQNKVARLNAHALCMVGNDLWIGTYGDGIQVLNLSTGQLTGYDRDNGLDMSSCYAICRDSRGRVWAGTMTGIHVFDFGKKRFRPVRRVGSLVIDIDEDRHGNLYFCTQGGGLFRLSPSGKWAHWLGLAQVNALCIDSSERVWVGTDEGLFAYNAVKSNFEKRKLTQTGGAVNSIAEEDGALWLGTNNGLVKYVPGQGETLFTYYDGLTGGRFQFNSALKTADGRLFFGTVQGFNVFRPYAISINRVAPKVFFTGLFVYNKPVEVGSETLPLSLTDAKRIDLGYKDRMVRLTFASLSYCTPEKNQYAYRLDGFDKDWIYCGSRQTATYTNLPAGTYTFRVKATNNDGVWSANEARVQIVVHPPFWWSWPAKLLYVLLAAGAVWMYVRLRLHRAEALHMEEMRRLNERKDLEEKESRLTFFTMIAHEIRTPVSLIIGPLESFMREVANHSGEPWLSKQTESLHIMDRNAHRLLELVNQLLDFNKVQQPGRRMHFTLCRVYEVMKAVAERFAPTLEQHGARLQVNYPPEDFTAVADSEGLTKVLSNLMTNATKYTRDWVRMSCSVQPDGKHFVLEVEDNGQGISLGDQKKIFNPFYQAQDNKPGTGIGLAIVENIVKMHEGKVSVESKPGHGALFRVVLPVTQQRVDVDEPKVLKTAKELTVATPSQAVPDKVAAPVPEVVKAPSVDKSAYLLIVEDDTDMLHFLSDSFRDDYTVVTAMNGQEALKQLKRNHIDLIISDWMMPVMDGEQLCKTVRGDMRFSHIPFVMLTAKTDDDSKTVSMDVGADVFIEKPFSVKYLKACIKHTMDMRRQLFLKYSSSPGAPVEQLNVSPVDDQLMSDMIRLIEENLTNDELGVKFLAEHLGMSRSALFAKVKALSDVTPGELIQVVRLKAAARLLNQKNVRINEVCYMVGYSSPSYFSRCFQKQFGISPTDYLHKTVNKS